MSKYEWEKGEIILPRNQWKDFRTELIATYNDNQDRRRDLAQQLKDEITEAVKGKKGSNRIDAMEDFLADKMLGDDWDVVDIIIKERKPSLKLRNPQKKDFPHLPTSKSCSLEFGEVTIVLDNDDRSLFYEVMENNHACETARQHPVVRKMFRLLNATQWGRNTGGTIYGNDEYNREEGEAGGGANYVNNSYGPLGER